MMSWRKAMRLSDLVRGVKGVRREKGPDVEVKGIAYHSARVRPGDLFVAVRGLSTDGHFYLREARRRGAVALVVEEGRRLDVDLPPGVAVVRAAETRRALAVLSDRFWGHPSGKLKLVGVTGTNGKTTTSHLVEAAAAGCGMATGLVGTVINRIRGREIPVERTTPESADLQQLLHSMVKEGCRVVSMEVSSHALALFRVEGCEFAAAVFTNLSQDHLDFHHDMESYFAAKARLFLPRSEGGLGAEAAAVNVDDPYGRRLLELTGRKALTFGLGEKARLRGELLAAGLHGSRIAVYYEGSKLVGDTRLAGSFNLYNILAAFAAALLLGLDPERSFQAILEHPGVPGRFQAVDEGQDFAVVVDYAHTPDSLHRLLRAAREITPGRVIVVFGCGGDRDRGKRPLMGEIASREADLVYITSDNPRSEEPRAVMEEIARGVHRTEGVYMVEERREAIEAAVAAAHSGDMVVIAGKGHERGQIFAHGTVPFDDVEEARRALRRRLSAV